MIKLLMPMYVTDAVFINSNNVNKIYSIIRMDLLDIFPDD